MLARFNKRQSKAPAPSPLSTPTKNSHPNAFAVSADGHHTPSLPPRHIAAPVPHPSPYARLIVHAGEEGLLLRPDVSARQCASYVCVSWGGANVSVVTTKDGAYWDGPVVYGVVGVTTVYQGASDLYFSLQLLTAIQSHSCSSFQTANRQVPVRHTPLPHEQL
jgi:hypothetical protein